MPYIVATGLSVDVTGDLEFEEGKIPHIFAIKETHKEALDFLKHLKLGNIISLDKGAVMNTIKHHTVLTHLEDDDEILGEL